MSNLFYQTFEQESQNKDNEFTELCEWLNKAIPIIKNGIANRLDKDGCILYKCGTIIRLDIKFEK